MPEREPKPKTASSNALGSHLAKIHPDSKKRQEPAPKQDALIEEISITGAVMSVGCPLRKGSRVRIDCRTCELRGKVTGCTKWSAGYIAEVAFPEHAPWQPAEFKPDGLFNPNYLVCRNPGCTPECVGGSCRQSEPEPDIGAEDG
jgi:hypothetical protein